MSLLGCCRFWLFIRSFKGQVEGGAEEFICRRTRRCLSHPPQPPFISLSPQKLIFFVPCSPLWWFSFLQGQDRWLHILCDVREECKELNESLDEMCPSRGRLICNKTPNLADALWPDTQIPTHWPYLWDPWVIKSSTLCVLWWLSGQDVSFEGESNFR